MNDQFRKEYKELTIDQKAQMKLVKDAADNLNNILENIPTRMMAEKDKRRMDSAKDLLEVVVMKAVKSITA